jgi:hypothetical protein
MTNDFLTFLGPCCPEQIDRCVDACLSDAPCLTDVGNSEKSDIFIGKDTGGVFESVTVGTGLDDSHQGHVRPSLGSDAKIVTEGGEIDFCPSAWW